MKNTRGQILYIGKAVNLRRRVSSYFERSQNGRIARLVREIRRIDFKKTDTALEALILEARLIKKHGPPYNIREKDDKSFLYVEITREQFPRVLVVRGKEMVRGVRFGPFISASHLREALRILRKIFPWSIHQSEDLGKFSRPCFEYEIGLCPGTCIGTVTKAEYRRNIKNLTLFFEGKKKRLTQLLTHEMKKASVALDFERAERLKRQLFALQHIEDVALIGGDSDAFQSEARDDERIEGYDISNISGTSAVGSMVVFRGGRPDKNQYRKFKIYSIHQSDDTGMLREVLRRRLRHREWPLPIIMLIDGGRGQVNAARSVLEKVGLKIPVIGIAKGPERKRNDFVGRIPRGLDRAMLIKVRDEAHRFAVAYHRLLRSRNSVS